MYASTSQASPRFDASSASGIDVGFKGALDLLRAWRDGRTPDPELTVSAWADSHRLLSPRGANEAGRWRTAGMRGVLAFAHPKQFDDPISQLISHVITDTYVALIRPWSECLDIETNRGQRR